MTTREIIRRERAYDLMHFACWVMDVNEPIGRVIYRVALRSYYRNGGGALNDE